MLPFSVTLAGITLAGVKGEGSACCALLLIFVTDIIIVFNILLQKFKLLEMFLKLKRAITFFFCVCQLENQCVFRRGSAGVFKQFTFGWNM